MAHSMNKKIETELRSLPGNNICCDCDERNPQWASVSFGVFMCLECSGRHRALGVHISFVRSVSMDSWTDKQIEMMRSGGNEKCIKFLKSYSVDKTVPIPQKYNTPTALLYKDRLLALVEGRPLPTELPSLSPNTSTKSTGLHNSKNINPAEMSPEEQAEWIAEQQRLQEEARERLRQKFGGSSGLSSSGKMPGLGSDPSYRPGGAQSSGITLPNLPPIDVDLSEVSQKTLDFFSNTWSALSEQVVKSTQHLLQEGPAGASRSTSEPAYHASSSSSSPYPPSAEASGPSAASSSASAWPTTANTDDLQEQLGKTWSLLSSGAVNLWKQASEATSELVGSITPNDPHHPHHGLYAGGDNASNNNHSNNSGRLTPSASSTSSMNSWDSMSDLHTTSNNHYPHQQQSSSNAGAGQEGGGVQPVTMSARMRASNKSAPSPNTTGGGGDKPKEDFFASFGV